MAGDREKPPPDTTESPSPGVLGDGADRPGKYNTALLRRAVREEWPIPPEVRAAVMTQMARVVKRSRKNRDKVAAAKVLVAADGVNVRREAVAAAEDSGPQDERRPLVVFYLPERREEPPAVVVDAVAAVADPIALPDRQEPPR